MGECKLQMKSTFFKIDQPTSENQELTQGKQHQSLHTVLQAVKSKITHYKFSTSPR